jgi:hypothetical protein
MIGEAGNRLPFSLREDLGEGRQLPPHFFAGICGGRSRLWLR